MTEFNRRDTEIMAEILNTEVDTWKIVFVKTIENKVPIYYRLVNLRTFEFVDIPAYRILDELVSKNMNIINLTCKNNTAVLLTEDGYEDAEASELIKVDEFDSEVPNLVTWALQDEQMGSDLLSRFDAETNGFHASGVKIDSPKKIIWQCPKKHRISCDFSTYYSTKMRCPICDAEDNDKMLSLRDWAYLTDNLDILNDYDNADNEKTSSEIGWKQKSKVYFKRNDQEVSEKLYNVTVKNIEPPFNNENKRSNIDCKK